MVLGEIHCYTNLFFDNSSVHVSYFIFYLETLQSDDHNIVFFPSVISVQ